MIAIVLNIISHNTIHVHVYIWNANDWSSVKRNLNAQIKDQNNFHN